MELWQFVDANYNAIIDAFIVSFFGLVTVLGALYFENKKLEKKLDDQQKLINEMDEFIQNNSRVWQ